MNKFMTATINGQTFLRQSASRSYSHMAVGLPNKAHAEARVTSPAARAQDERNARWHLLHLESEGLATWSPARSAAPETVVTTREYLGWFRRNTSANPVTATLVTDEEVRAEAEKNLARAKEALRGCTTPAEYADRKERQRRAVFNAQVEAGHFEKFVDLGWASRLDLAQKNADGHRSYYVSVQVLPVTEVDGATYRNLKKAAK